MDFVEDFKLNLYMKFFVFTPNGELKSLPQGSTALDFAFFIHSEIGKKTRGVRVNNRLVPLSKILKSGDQIEVITSENIKPTINWLDFVVTSHARSIIKSSINEQEKIRAIEGKEILRRKLKSLKLNNNNKTINEMLEYFKFKNVQDYTTELLLAQLIIKNLKDLQNHTKILY